MPMKTCSNCNSIVHYAKGLCQKCYGVYARANAIANGLCAICHAKPLITKTACEDCNNKAKKWSKSNKGKISYKNRYEKRLTIGLCSACGKYPLFSKTRCKICLDVENNKKRKLKHEVYNAYGGIICNCCGTTEEVFLSIDHINEDGAAHRKVITPASLCKWLKKNNFPPEYQILCMNCQRGKYVCGVCPHKLRKPEPFVFVF